MRAHEFVNNQLREASNKNSQAVAQLKSALLAHKEKLEDVNSDEVYRIIDQLMTRIAKAHKISGKELHDMWVKQYKKIPDAWILSDASTTEEDYDPNDTPPGPEFKPTMPAGTVRVDVSDVYDWYKLGQHISNLKGLGKHDFGKGPPSTILSFGSEEEEHKYIDALKKTGLSTTDIDPIDPKQPKGMRRQKTDPAYNVGENFAEARKNPEQNTKYQSGWAELAAWTRKNNVWLKPHEWAISMTYVPKLGINPGPGISEDTPRGIYFYPFQWAYSVKMDKEALPWADNAPYIQLFQYSTGTELYDPNQIPLASAVAQLKNYGITDEDIAAEKENNPSISTYNLLVWCLGRKYDDNKRVTILNKVLRNLGYDYMIDNGKGWIAINEPTQGVVLNPKIIDKVVTFNNYTRKKEQDIEENFADGKNPGRKGLSKRVGVNTKASVSDLRKTAKNSSGEKQRMAHWLANMKAGRAKARRK